MGSNKRKELIEKYNDIEKNAKKNILDELKDNDLLYVEDNIKVASNVCIILSCPGQEELIADKVCAGETGENLEKILEIVRQGDKTNKLQQSEDGIEGKQRYAYSIINSVRDVYFRAYNGAEADEDAVVAPGNIDRINKELATCNIKYFIVCGNNAKLLYEQLKSQFINVEVSYVSHIGWVGLRNEYKNDNDELKGLATGKERDEKRLELVANKIVKDLKL